ncbi:sensor histidine kinase [Streptomyces mimosae]|uniref:sensor histidine kinase n=1 Tax=Streptomyces mimosae TaxID=2586635 RepID=UPI001D04E50D|nr:histidine kinase [Streptomyces mimosae]
MPRWVRELRQTSHQRRVHAYTRYTLYFISLSELLAITSVLLNARPLNEGWASLALWVLVTHHVFLMLMATRDGLRHYLAGTPRPTRLIAWTTAFTCATSLLVGGAVALDLVDRRVLPVTLMTTMFYAGPTALLLPLRRAAVLMAAPIACCLAAFALRGPDLTAMLLQVTFLLLVGLFMGGTYRASAWTLRVLDRVDAARETEKRLAVAEERLRFGRDLHDVLGRNLSVIALKTELAAQLARRGSPDAAEQLAEVQRIARESQREIREVVRGYREVDLRAELAGARGVLEAADIRCSLTGASTVAPSLPPKVGSALGWVVREGVTNVLRHSSATRCDIRFGRSPDGWAELSLENDGSRVDGARPDQAGSGLAGLRERLAALGGTLSVESVSDGVFRLTARVPLDREGAEAPGAGAADGAVDGAARRREPSVEEEAENVEREASR